MTADDVLNELKLAAHNIVSGNRLGTAADAAKFANLWLQSCAAPEAGRTIPIGTLVDRFLAWKLPEDFHPDAGISFQPYFNVEWNAKHGRPPQRNEPIGTNLLTADQARAMLEHVLAPMMGSLPKRAHCCRLLEDVPQKCPDCPASPTPQLGAQPKEKS